MNIVFLDFDGVLNTPAFRFSALNNTIINAKDRTDLAREIDPVCVERLNRLVLEANVQFVISSAWRIGYTLSELRMMLKRRGFIGKVIDLTPSSMSEFKTRGQEIVAWLAAQTEQPESFVIIDDFDDMDDLTHRLVRTDEDVGLLDDHIDLALEMLKS